MLYSLIHTRTDSSDYLTTDYSSNSTSSLDV